MRSTHHRLELPREGFVEGDNGIIGDVRQEACIERKAGHGPNAGESGSLVSVEGESRSN